MQLRPYRTANTAQQSRNQDIHSRDSSRTATSSESAHAANILGLGRANRRHLDAERSVEAEVDMYLADRQESSSSLKYWEVFAHFPLVQE